MGNCNYTWFRYNINATCVKCGNKMTMQTTQGSPQCDDCGELSRQNWEELLDISDITDLRKNKTGSKKIFGVTEMNAFSENVTAVNCYHCKTVIDPHEDLHALKSYDCPTCKEKINFEVLNSYKGLVFYRYVNQKISEANKSALIAVRCAACGAPLETDPSKTNYHCQFCGVENILPPSLRQRRVLDDVFVGVQKQVVPPIDILQSNSILQITSSLKENKRESFSDETLNALMEKFPDNLQIYHIIANDLRHTFSEETFEKLWNTSKSAAFLNIIGRKINRSNEQINAQIRKVDPSYNSAQKNKTKENSVSEKSFLDKLKGFFK